MQLPLPAHIREEAVTLAVSPEKDVDCFHPANVGLVMSGQPRFYPCTPHGVVELLRRNDIALAGKHVVVVGRSNIVGKPLAVMLMQKPTSSNPARVRRHGDGRPHAHAGPRGGLPECRYYRRGGGQGRADYPEMVRPGAAVVDVGTNFAGGKLVGDVAPEVAAVAGHLSPVPGGVGPMTIAMLLSNTLRAAVLTEESGRAMNLNITTATRYGLNILALLGMSAAFYLGSSIFIPLTISILLATILYPAARWLNSRLHLPWFIACLFSVLMLVLLHLAVFSAIAASIPQLINKLPANREAWAESIPTP